MSKLLLLFLLPIALLAQTGASSLNTRQSGTGAVSRSVESALNAFPANISSYGGDLQATICALPTAGGTVVIDVNLTLTINITACSKTSIIVRKLAGITVTGAFTVLGSAVVGGVGEEWYGNTSSTPALSVPTLAATGLTAGTSGDVAACIGAGGIFHAGGCVNTHAMVTVLDTAGCDSTGVADSTSCINTAVIAAAGGGLRIPAGTYLTGEIDIPSHTFINCDAGTTKIVRNGAIAAGHGWINVGDYGTVNVASDGITVTLATGDNFLMLQLGDKIYVNGILKTVATLIDSTHITITPTTGGILSGVSYVASRTGVTIDGCVFDGQVLTPATHDRATLPSSLDAAYTLNGTLWLHGGQGITIKNGAVQHSGGYPTILDASMANIDDLTISGMNYQYNRSFLWGSPGDYNYGGWQGGILAYSDSIFGITNSSIVDNFFKQNTGHSIFWDARNGNSALNRNIVESRNHFKTIGLDAMENSGIATGAVEDNTFERIGFISTADTDLLGTARWYNGPSGNVGAVAIDTASLVIGMTITGNTFRLINGGVIDGDGLGDSVVAHNHAHNPKPGDADYDSTVAGQMGPAVYVPFGCIAGYICTAGQNWMSFFNAGNTNNTSQGGANLKIIDNSIYGFGGGAIKMYSSRNATVSGNTITLPDDSNSTSDHNFSSPIMLGNTPVTNGHNTNVTVTNNKIIYAGSGAFPVVVEDGQYAAYTSGQANYVYDDDIPPLFQPFSKDINSSSVSYGANSTTASGVTSAGYNLAITTSGSTAVTTVRNQIELNGGNTLSRWYSGASPLTTSNLMFTASSNGALYLGNGTTTGSLYWGATPLISATQDFYAHSLTVGGNIAIATTRDATLNSITDVGSSSLTLDSSRNFRGNSLSTGTASVANSAAGLAIAGDRTGYLSQLFLGTNGASPLKAIDASNNHTANSFYAGSSVTGATQFLVTATSGTGCTTLAPCVNVGNIGNFVQSNAASTVSFAAPVGFGGTVNATGLGTLSGGGSILCLDGSGFMRSSGCPGASAPLVLGSTSFTGNNPLIALSAGGFDNSHDYSPATGLLGAGATSQDAVLEYFHPFAYEGLRREGAIVGGVVTSSGDSNWESDAVIGMAVANNAAVLGGGSVAGSFFALGNATNAVAWGINTLVSDVNRSLATSLFDYSHNHAAYLVGGEMDHQAANVGTIVSGLNLGVAYLGISHTNAIAAGLAFNVTGGSAPNYWDYGIISRPGAAIVGIHLDRQNSGNSGSACTTVGGICTGASISSNSQFLDFVSGSSGQYTARIFTTTGGYLGFFPNTFNITNYVAVGPAGDLFVEGGGLTITGANATVTGVGGTPSIVATNGYMQSGDGFYSNSSLTNALHFPNGGALIKDLSLTDTVYNSLTSSGGATLAGTIRATAQTAVFGTGTGTELLYDTGTGRGYLQAYNRSASAFVPLSVDGSTLNLNVQTNGQVAIGAGGLTTTGGATIAANITTGSLSSTGSITTNTLYRVSGINGVSCSGTPTSSFASIGGIVTHC